MLSNAMNLLMSTAELGSRCIQPDSDTFAPQAVRLIRVDFIWYWSTYKSNTSSKLKLDLCDKNNLQIN